MDELEMSRVMITYDTISLSRLGTFLLKRQTRKYLKLKQTAKDNLEISLT